jgi:predicted SAM-dependent methyltransferase
MHNKFDYSSFPNKLNLGCGYDILKGYLNIDLNEFHHPDLVADVTNLKMLPSNYYIEILAYDVLEHIERTKTKEVLAEWNRLLIPGGLIKIRVPNLIGLLSLFSKNDYQGIKKQEELIQCCFGTQAYNGDFHYTSFTESLIRHYLKVSGFEGISIMDRDEWLFEITAKKMVGLNQETDKDRTRTRDFLHNAYLDILYREPDDEGYNYFFNQLSSGKMEEETVLIILKNSDERKKITNKS